MLARGDNAVVTARDAAAVQDLADAHPGTALALAARRHRRRAGRRRGPRPPSERFGGVDVLVNNAGYGYRAAVEEGDDADVRRLFETHVSAPSRTIKAVLPGMRARRSGAIVNLSSIGARISPEGSGYYAAVKAAVEALTLSLRKEVAPLGITATAVEPGGFRTDFAGRSLTQAATPIADYADTAGKRRKEHDTVHGTQPGDPAKAAARDHRGGRVGPTRPSCCCSATTRRPFRAALDALRTEVDAWEALSPSTDFDT